MTHTRITPEMIEAAEEAYMPFGDMGLAIQCALAAAPQPPEAAPVPQFSRIAQKKLDYLLEAGEVITGYAIENKDGRRGAIDCHGFVYWWQDAAVPVQQGWKLVPVDPTQDMIDAADQSDRKYSQRAFGGAMHLSQSGEDHWHAMLAAAPQPPEADHIPDAGKMVAAPVQLPEPVAAESRFTTFDGNRWRWCTVEHARAFGADKGYEVRYLYTEHQVRQLLSAREQST